MNGLNAAPHEQHIYLWLKQHTGDDFGLNSHFIPNTYRFVLSPFPWPPKQQAHIAMS